MDNQQKHDSQMDWIDPKGELTFDQWMACHLLFYTNILKQKYYKDKEVNRPDLKAYARKAKVLIKQSIAGASEFQLSNILHEANDLLCDIYINVNRENSDSNEKVKVFYLSTLRNIVDYVKENLADIIFNDYFTDITYDDGGLYSPMAVDIMANYVAKMELEEDEHFGDPDQCRLRDTACLFYKENWEKHSRILFGFPAEKILIFHILALNLCDLCLSRELYEVYQKTVINAVTAYKEKSDLKQKHSALVSANEAIARVMKRVLTCIQKGVFDKVKYLPKNEFFVLAVDGAIETAKEIDPSTTYVALKHVNVKYDDLIVKGQVKEWVDRLYFHAMVVCSHIYAYDEEADEQVWEDEPEDYDPVEELVERYKSSWNSVRGILNELPLECLLVYHTINLIFCYKCFETKQFVKYRNAVHKAVSIYKGKSTQQQKEAAIKAANEALIKLKGKVFDWILRAFDNEQEMSYQNDLFTMSSDKCLQFVKKSIDLKAAIDLLKDIFVKDNTIQFPHILESYALNIYTRSAKECTELYKELNGEDDDWEDEDDDWEDEDDDWEDEDDDLNLDEEDLDEGNIDNPDQDLDEDEDDDDWDEDDDDWDEGELEEESDLQAHMTYIFSELCGLGEEGLLFHAVSVEIMRRLLPDVIYESYRKSVNKLLSDFFNGAKRNTIEGNQLDADNEYVNTIYLITDLVENWDSSKIEGEPYDYMIISIATENCLYGIIDRQKTDVDKALKQLTYNKAAKGFKGEIVGKLASKYINMARKELDGMFDE